MAWLGDRFQIDAQGERPQSAVTFAGLIHSTMVLLFCPEARTFGSMLVALGYIYPLQDHRRIVIKDDASLYRFQVSYNKDNGTRNRNLLILFP